MTVALYPTSISPLPGYIVEPVFSLQKTQTKSGVDVSEKLWSASRHRIKLLYQVSVTNAATLLNFHEARLGSYEAFDFIDFNRRAWVGAFVAASDATTPTFDLPVYGCAEADCVGYISGSSSPVAFGSGTGANGRDRMTFQGPPIKGSIITCDVVGQRVYTVRFEFDNLPYKTLPQFSGGVEMLELQVSLVSQR